MMSLKPTLRESTSGFALGEFHYPALDNEKRNEIVLVEMEDKDKAGDEDDNKAVDNDCFSIVIDNMGPRIMCVDPRIRIQKRGPCQRFGVSPKPDRLQHLSENDWTSFRRDIMLTWRLNQLENIMIPCAAIFMSSGIIFVALHIHASIRYGVFAVLCTSLILAVYHTYLRKTRMEIKVTKYQRRFASKGYRLRYKWRLGGAFAYIVIDSLSATSAVKTSGEYLEGRGKPSSAPQGDTSSSERSSASAMERYPTAMQAC